MRIHEQIAQVNQANPCGPNAVIDNIIRTDRPVRRRILRIVRDDGRKLVHIGINRESIEVIVPRSATGCRVASNTGIAEAVSCVGVVLDNITRKNCVELSLGWGKG